MTAHWTSLPCPGSVQGELWLRPPLGQGRRSSATLRPATRDGSPGEARTSQRNRPRAAGSTRSVARLRALHARTACTPSRASRSRAVVRVRRAPRPRSRARRGPDAASRTGTPAARGSARAWRRPSKSTPAVMSVAPGRLSGSCDHPMVPVAVRAAARSPSLAVVDQQGVPVVSEVASASMNVRAPGWDHGLVALVEAVRRRPYVVVGRGSISTRSPSSRPTPTSAGPPEPRRTRRNGEIVQQLVAASTMCGFRGASPTLARRAGRRASSRAPGLRSTAAYSSGRSPRCSSSCGASVPSPAPTSATRNGSGRSRRSHSSRTPGGEQLARTPDGRAGS